MRPTGAPSSFTLPLPHDDAGQETARSGDRPVRRPRRRAVSSARTQAERHVTERLTIARASDIKVRVERVDVRFSDGYGKEMKFVNAVFVKATGTGKPSLDEGTAR